MTTAFAAKDALVDLLRDAPPLKEIADDDAIWYGYFGGESSQRPREVVWIGETTWEETSGAAIGFNRRDETYEIIMTIESHMPGDDQTAANHRVRDRMATIVELLRDPRSLGVAGVYEVGVIPQMLGEGSDPGGRGAILVTSVRIRARF